MTGCSIAIGGATAFSGEASRLHEAAHDSGVHLGRSRKTRYAGKHVDARFGRGAGEGLDMPTSLRDHSS